MKKTFSKHNIKTFKVHFQCFVCVALLDKRFTNWTAIEMHQKYILSHYLFYKQIFPKKSLDNYKGKASGIHFWNKNIWETSAYMWP